MADKTPKADRLKELREEQAKARERKPGRPRVEDRDSTIEALKPWKALGMSRATWFARQAEKRLKDDTGG